MRPRGRAAAADFAAFNIQVRVYQDDTQGETRGLNPPITYQTRRRLLANRVTCNLLPELRCMVKNSGTAANGRALAKIACDRLRGLGDSYCDYIPKLCSLNNAGNPEGVYGMSNVDPRFAPCLPPATNPAKHLATHPATHPATQVTVAQFANQRLSLRYGMCCVEEDTRCIAAGLTASSLAGDSAPLACPISLKSAPTHTGA